MEKKPDPIDIFKHVNSSWDLSRHASLALDWVAVRYEDFCKENYLTSDSYRHHTSYDQFTIWLLEKYWPDWEESYNG